MTRPNSRLSFALVLTMTASGLASSRAQQDATTTVAGPIAVMPFETPISTFRGGGFISGLTPGQAQSFGDALAQLVTTSLVKSGSPVVDRSHLAHIMREQKLDNSGAVDTATAVQIGKLCGARYMIFGSVQSFNVREENQFVVHKTVGEIEAEASLVDVTTGRIVKTFSGKGSRQTSGLAAGVVTFNGVDQSRGSSSGSSAWLSMPLVGDAAKSLAGQIVTGLVPNQIKLLDVLSVDPKEGIIVDFGSACPYSERDRVVIQRVVKVIRNSAGAVVYQQLKPLGSGTVLSVQGTAFTIKPDRLSEPVAEHDQIVLKAQ